MENFLYSPLGMKNQKVNPRILNDSFMESNLTIATILENEVDLKTLSNEQLVMAFCEDLKEILAFESLSEVVQSILALESDLSFIKEELNKPKGLPTLEKFFRHLSPLLMQSFLENNEEENAEAPLMKGWLEAIRIALEEEIYIWQEKLKQKN